MILQALKEYYDRKATDPESDIAPEGFEKKPIPFLIVIDRNGKFINLEDTREKIGKKSIAKTFLVPRSKPRAGSLSYKTTFLLWDHAGYVLQHPDDEKAKNQHSTWLRSLKELPPELNNHEGVAAILKFYDSGGVDDVKSHPTWGECTKVLSCNMTFKLAGEISPIPCYQAVQEYVNQALKASRDTADESIEDKVVGRCLVTGEVGEIVRVHSDTRISKDSKKLVGFQKKHGFDSYGKEQGYNAPVGKSAEFAYTTSLNTLLKSNSRMLVGDAVTVCWSEKSSDLENHIADFFSEPPKDDPDRGVEAVRSLFRSLESGVFQTQRDNRFYVLGLAPNSARIAVRFWIVDTVAGMASKIKLHFDDLRIVHGPRDKDVFSLFRLLVSTAVQGKANNISPNLAGETMRSILEGLPYPKTLLQAAIRRIRAEHEIIYPRAALIKACINRSIRYKNSSIKEELKMSLDENNTNIGYRLGRLFAALEKIQIRKFTQGGGKEPNSTIRDKYYGSASGTPATVFGTLIRLSKHHLSGLDNVGERINFERLLGEIVSDICDFPPHLKLEDQGRFAIGYYHQMQAFYTKKEKQD
ncbi:MAG: type I-C CRISPR-associated protein Cas8c/Csd1 [Desulfobacterales bacterium]|uniref:Type I-C CRISPR-associated protein Cas8c/Csd1 n=1 Tax=Candidatus Desulfatibia vada TaxID=2841696 RepID=A0A8J6TS59_9BACT|nr:type I-C CRISPR-associated protein Cas8c/Csd1 [Candidatus Desulfatibia vada]